MFCKQCGFKYDDNKERCPKCSARRGKGQLYCAFCGTRVAPDVKTCVKCGKPYISPYTHSDSEKSKDKPVKTVETVKTIETVNAVETVQTVKTVETIEPVKETENIVAVEIAKEKAIAKTNSDNPKISLRRTEDAEPEIKKEQKETGPDAIKVKNVEIVKGNALLEDITARGNTRNVVADKMLAEYLGLEYIQTEEKPFSNVIDEIEKLKDKKAELTYNKTQIPPNISDNIVVAPENKKPEENKKGFFVLASKIFGKKGGDKKKSETEKQKAEVEKEAALAVIQKERAEAKLKEKEEKRLLIKKTKEDKKAQRKKLREEKKLIKQSHIVEKKAQNKNKKKVKEKSKTLEENIEPTALPRKTFLPEIEKIKPETTGPEPIETKTENSTKNSVEGNAEVEDKEAQTVLVPMERTSNKRFVSPEQKTDRRRQEILRGPDCGHEKIKNDQWHIKDTISCVSLALALLWCISENPFSYYYGGASFILAIFGSGRKSKTKISQAAIIVLFIGGFIKVMLYVLATEWAQKMLKIIKDKFTR